MVHNIALKLAYDGSAFFGWQKTSMGPSIEQTLEECLVQILQEEVVLQAASRTDRGVHAQGQWVNFITNKNYSLDRILKSLNALLPTSIRILFIHQAPHAFHPTLHAIKKRYDYQISCGPIQQPMERFYSWHVPYKLNFEKMREASTFFLGEHDFSSFCNQRKNLCYKNKQRSLYRLMLERTPSGGIIFTIEGNSFLYKMVRNIVGTLVYVGRNKIQPQDILSIIQGCCRFLAGMTAPAHGLTLKEIYYPEELIPFHFYR